MIERPRRVPAQNGAVVLHFRERAPGGRQLQLELPDSGATLTRQQVITLRDKLTELARERNWHHACR